MNNLYGLSGRHHSKCIFWPQIEVEISLNTFQVEYAQARICALKMASVATTLKRKASFSQSVTFNGEATFNFFEESEGVH